MILNDLRSKLRCPNSIWHKVTSLFYKTVGLALLAIFFFTLITPASLIARLLGRDRLKIKKRSVHSYWEDHPFGEISSKSFNDQY
jgi:hypothetical protein